jgi:hypothetical protein
MKPQYIILFFILLFLASCSPQHRLQHLLTSHPELKVPDTLLVKDTIIIPGTSIDTSVNLVTLKDTVVISKDNLVLQLKTKHDTLFIQGKCKADTVIKTIHVPAEKIRVIKPDRTTAFISKIPWIVIGLITIIAALIFFFRK